MSSESLKKSTVSAGDFRLALGKVLRAAAKKSIVPCLGEARADFHGDTCTLTCTNLIQWCQVTIPAHGDNFSFVFHNTRSLLTACKYFSGNLEFAYMADEDSARSDPDGTLTLRCENKSSIQRVTTAKDFPVLPDLKTEYSYTANTNSLYERYKRIKYAVLKNNSRSSRSCIEFVDNRMLAVDGRRLALNRDEEFRVQQSLFIPTEALDLLLVFDGTDCNLEVGGLYAAFINDSIRIITRLQEGDDWNVDHAIPQKFREEHTVSVKDFTNNLRYLYEFSKGEAPVRFDSGVLSIKTNSGEYSASLDLASASQAMCGFNPAYMLDGLNQFKAKKAKSVTLRLDSPVTPIVLTDGGNDIAMVLPVNLNKVA